MHGEISTLYYEVVDYSMEGASFVTKSIFSSTESSEVFSSFGTNATVELKNDFANIFATDFNIHPNFCSI